MSLPEGEALYFVGQCERLKKRSTKDTTKMIYKRDHKNDLQKRHTRVKSDLFEFAEEERHAAL